MGFAGLREPALRLRRDFRPDHFPRVPRKGPPGRRRYENQCRDPPFATSFFLAQAPLALKGAKDGAPAEAKQDQIPRASAAPGMTALKTRGTERFFVRPRPTQNDNGSDRDGSTGKSACATEWPG